MSRIFKIGRIGTKEIRIEEEETPRAACYKAGWAPEWCRVVDITDEMKRLRENGELEVIS